MTNFVRVAVAIGLCVDTGVAIIALFFQQFLGPLFDIPLKDPALTTIAGGEYIVVALIYVMILRDPKRYHALLWLCALDQAFAACLPALEIIRGNVVATYKTIGPIPINVVLCGVYLWAVTRAENAALPR